MGKRWTPVRKNQFPTPHVLVRIYTRSEVGSGCRLAEGSYPSETRTLIASELGCGHYIVQVSTSVLGVGGHIFLEKQEQRQSKTGKAKQEPVHQPPGPCLAINQPLVVK